MNFYKTLSINTKEESTLHKAAMCGHVEDVNKLLQGLSPKERLNYLHNSKFK